MLSSSKFIFFVKTANTYNKLVPNFTQLFSTNAAPAAVQSTVKAKRTSENNPTNHTDDHVGLFYTVPDSVQRQLFSTGGLPKSFAANIKTFTECSFMVRKPAVDLIQRLNATDFSRPPVRHVLYGQPGCGKSIILAHLLHYALVNKFVIIHVPWTWNWFRRDWTEVAYNSKDRRFVDLPVLSAQWLKHFLLQNGTYIDALQLRTSQDYVWSQREQTPAGSPLSALINHGINRVKFAGDCVAALLQELKLACNEDKCKAFVAIDGFNALVNDYETRLKTEDKVKVRTRMVTLSRSFRQVVQQDWKNAAVLLTVDQLAASYRTLDSHWPIHLLGREGFETIDPFIPISVTEYSDLELNSALDYYEDRMWLQRTEGRQDLGFLSNRNPYSLMELCAGL
ncbi:ribosomal protein S29 [Nesidiocoris tenuis]|uniref:Small ribosomal subunit protein mS29 n=1 Tax=Nesidiocoris tenuis TaxID=355587 RepID=A0ABN7AZ92_9HEMI|nr:ribosomal protein S29 [Nesidiocoris tenuis]